MKLFIRAKFTHFESVKTSFLTLFFCTSFYTLSACTEKNDSPNHNDNIPDIHASELLPAGAASVSFKPFPSFMLPAKNLPQSKRPDFHAGKALANQPWVKAPTITTARDGLGPVYNARSCLGCHISGGKGRMPDDGSNMLFSAFVRISLPGSDTINGVIPEPTYGDQLQSQSVALFHQIDKYMPQDDPSRKIEVPPEAYVYVDWQQKEFIYPDGEITSLRWPKLRIENLGYGELHPKTLMSLRNAPAIHGVGLLELIDQQDIDQGADPLDANTDGISGRVNMVWDVEANKTVAGRFGWKANRSNLHIVTAAAFAGDVGITNALFPNQPCTKVQKKCLRTPNGNDKEGVELPKHLLKLVTNFSRNLGVPKQRPGKDKQTKKILEKGRTLFYQTGCNRCHTPSFVTQNSTELPHLGNQRIWPYTDLLIHDMGPALADKRPDYLASGSEWRTAPLWGAGLNMEVNGSNHFLHDGRAQSIEEAVLWHGGEAEASKLGFSKLSPENRLALIKFIESI